MVCFLPVLQYLQYIVQLLLDRINEQLSTVESGRTTNSCDTYFKWYLIRFHLMFIADREVTDVPVFTVSSRDYIKVSREIFQLNCSPSMIAYTL